MGNKNTSKPRYAVALLGGGRVGQTLGYLLKRRGHAITTVICHTRAHAKQAADFIGQGQPAAHPAILNSVAWDCLLITTPDQTIIPMARSMAGYALAWGRKVVLHCSGYLSSAALQPLAEKGATVASMHPLQTFARPAEAIHVVRGSYFALEGNPRGVRIARALVSDLGGQVVTIPTDGKTLYHCAAFLASGHLSTLVALAVSLLKRIGLSETKAKAVLHPLMARTLDNLKQMPIGQAITGPISRGDVETVQAHLHTLKATDPQALAVYRQLGEIMIDLLNGPQLSASEARRLKRVLRAL